MENSIHEQRVKEMLAVGQTIVIVQDADNKAWESGWADYLSENYNYSNLNSAFRVNLLKHKNHAACQEG